MQKEVFFDLQLLKKWFFLQRRSLPWRENPSPYAVWISEVMLQQTQVAVVIPYFQKWMNLFPTTQALAEAERKDVIKAWEGLGYYSRARNLHEGARYLLAQHGGQLPEDPLALQKVKGLGPYTIGAIRSFAFKKKAAAVDGNVLRVLSRLFGIKEPIDLPSTRRTIEQLTEKLLPDDEPWIIMEALIELGALVCKKKASCVTCPLKEKCRAYQENKVDILPQKRKKIPTTFLHRLTVIVQSPEGLLLKKGASGKVMADLWEFPYLELSKPPEGKSKTLQEVQKLFSRPLIYKQALPLVKHGFTRYQATLYPYYFTSDASFPLSGYEWVPLKEVKTHPFSSGHRRVLKHLINIV